MFNKRYNSWEEFLDDCKIEIDEVCDRELVVVKVIPRNLVGMVCAKFDRNLIMSWRCDEREVYQRVASVLVREIENYFGSCIKPSY